MVKSRTKAHKQRVSSKARSKRVLITKGDNATYMGYLGSRMPSKRNPKISQSLFERRMALQSFKRYGTNKSTGHQVRYFRPKLMVDVKTGKVYASPLAGGSYLVNPKRKKIMKRRRKSITRFFAKKARRKAYRRNPIAIKKVISKQNLMTVATLGIGFVGGIKAHKYINNMSFLADYRRFTGLIPFVIGTLVALKGKKQSIKNIGAGVSLAGFYDLITQNVPQLKLAPVEGVDIEDNYSGTVVDVNGQVVDLQGQDVVVGEDTVVGEDDSPYFTI